MNIIYHNLHIILNETRIQIIILLRTPQFLLPALFLPAALYSFFTVIIGHGQHDIIFWLFGTYVIFAAINPSLFGFGAGIATEREANMLTLRKVSPMSPISYFIGKTITSLLVTLTSVICIAIIAIINGLTLSPLHWFGAFFIAALSTIPFSLIGINLGLWLSSQAASAFANILMLLFALFGGLWIPLSQMPHWVGKIAWIIPSFHLGQLALFLIGALRPNLVGMHLCILILISFFALMGALIGWHRSNT